MSDLRKAAERALEALETLWDILDDIDTTSDIAKENDAWYRKRVEFLQKKRWDTTITTDGYKLKGGAVEALRQALAQKGKECIYPECETGIGCDGPCGEKPVDETAKHRHEVVAWHEPGAYGNVTTHKDWALANGWEPLYKEKKT